MRILHISDFHFKPGKAHIYKRQVDRLIASLAQANAPFDMICFTGDLVNSGTSYNDFTDASTMLFPALSRVTGFDNDLIFVCPGNHDIARNAHLKSVDALFEKINDNNSLDELYDGSSRDFALSLEPSANYFKYIQTHYASGVNVIQPLFTTHKRQIGEQTIGIATFNTAWRSKDDNDKNNLFLPASAVELAIDQLRGTDFRIALMHHPFSWLKNFNVDEIEDLVCGNFNILLSGHVHLERNATSFIRNNGIFAHTARASLAKSGEIGYSIIEVEDIENPCITRVEEQLWQEAPAQYLTVKPVIYTIPMTETKAQQNKLRQTVRSKYLNVLGLANELLVEFDPTDKDAFLRTFKNPSLNAKPEAELGKSDQFRGLDFDTLLSSPKNYLIFGKSKYGKTSLLRRVELFHLSSFPEIDLVPIYIDFKEYNAGAIDLLTLISRITGINHREVQELMGRGEVRLLLDNYSSTHSLAAPLDSLLTTYTKVKFIACSEWTASYALESAYLDNNVQSLFFHDLGRKEIRHYAKAVIDTDEKDIDDILAKLVSVCNQMHFPVSYWTVGLLLHIHKRSSDFAEKDIYNILDLYVEEALDRRGLQRGNHRFDYDTLRSLCTDLAIWLYQNHSSNIYSATSTQIIDFISELQDRKIRFVAEPFEVFSYLENAGILSQKSDDLWTFRLNGVFEFFLAQAVSEQPSFREEILDNPDLYINFGNELEIYSGQRKNDAELLSQIFDKTRIVLDPITSQYAGDLDAVLLDKLSSSNPSGIHATVDGHISGMDETVLTEGEKDDALDINSPTRIDTEVRMKSDRLSLLHEFSLMERYLSIFARVFRNIGDVDSKLIEECFSYIVRNYCYLGFRILDEAEAQEKEEPSESKEIATKLLSLLASIVPLLMQVSLNDCIGHYNLSEVILRRISELKTEAASNQYELFMLHLLLVDIDPRRNQESLDDLFDLLSIGILRSSLLIKMLYYLSFKASKDKEFEKQLRIRIEKLKKKIDSSYKPGGLSSFLEKRRKERLRDR